ncbi:hypothetical protein [Pantanalinema sp. GBBB05]|uniref:hypothetical protein n=1 Tax=Pantanalinema sp. GBBB05 TaxID=2604139 RepID=UPI001DF872FA|nr:hypothetical protein [Pantanalinema sp. GBBB05]
MTESRDWAVSAHHPDGQTKLLSLRFLSRGAAMRHRDALAKLMPQCRFRVVFDPVDEETALSPGQREHR